MKYRLLKITLILGLLLCLFGMTVSPVLAQAHPNDRNVEGFLTGGGQITAGDYKVSFAGNVGASLVGHWQTNFHNVSEDSLDGARFHSTSIIFLEFISDDVAHIEAQGMLNGEDGYSLNIWLADRGEPGTMIDSISIQLWDGEVDKGEMKYHTLEDDFPNNGQGATLIHGNFQIHS